MLSIKAAWLFWFDTEAYKSKNRIDRFFCLRRALGSLVPAGRKILFYRILTAPFFLSLASDFVLSPSGPF
jgi:hypothetical protein